MTAVAGSLDVHLINKVFSGFTAHAVKDLSWRETGNFSLKWFKDGIKNRKNICCDIV